MKVISTGTTLYKRDTKGKVRVWFYEIGTDGDVWGWRTTAGLQDGQKVTSGWTTVEAKNVGKANEVSPERQAYAEAVADGDKKLAKGYFLNINAVDTFDKFKPMLAHGYEEDSINWAKDVVFTQPKLDGIRCIARADGLWTRTGKPITSVPHIWELIREVFEANPQLVLDGELYNHNLRDNFNEITSIVRKAKVTADEIEKAKATIQYHVYDYLIEDNDARPFVDRQSNLTMLFDNFWDTDVIQQVETVWVQDADELDALYGELLELGYEGQMVRQGKSVYENKRTKNLLKRKDFLSDEFKVLGILEGNGNWNGCVKHLSLQHPVVGEFKSGIRGKKEVLRAMFENNDVPDWATIRYFKPTPDGVPRFPVAVDWGKGKRED